MRRSCPILPVLIFFAFTIVVGDAQTLTRKNVLILNEVGPSHALTSLVTQELVNGVPDTPNRHVEFYSESSDVLSVPNGPSELELRNWLVKKYGSQNLDIVVAVGPETIRFLTQNAQQMFSNVPVVICGSASDQAGNPSLDSRFTGTWQQREPIKTLEVALRLFPDTRHVFVVGGTSAYDRTVMSFTKDSLKSFSSNAEITYLTEIEMGDLVQRLHNLPEHSVVFYVSFFQDARGSKFVNATRALPMVASAANAPVFGMSDTYLGHGIIGGSLMSFRQQARVTARIVTDLLDGKSAREIPIQILPSQFMFDWNELVRWHVSERMLPAGSTVLFREPSLWERTKWMWATVLLVIFGLAGLIAYLQHSRRKLVLAQERQRKLSGMLINAGENERSKVAAELHDDFSQRVAVIALNLESLGETLSPLSPKANRQLKELMDSTVELGEDLHTLSHRLHSSALENLGLASALSALCKEFSAQQMVEVDFKSNGIPSPVHPDTALCVFRIVQEALRNLKKHSGAQKGRVTLWVDGGKLKISIQDTGYGIDPKKLGYQKGLGIRSMEERAHLLGGELTILSTPGNGTTVNAWLPLTPSGLDGLDIRCP
jgi:signal transduction histidine kinase